MELWKEWPKEVNWENLTEWQMAKPKELLKGWNWGLPKDSQKAVN